MNKAVFKPFAAFWLVGLMYAMCLPIGCTGSSVQEPSQEVEWKDAQGDDTSEFDGSLKVGAERMKLYLDRLEGKKVGLCGNHTSRIGDVRLPDTLIAAGVDLVRLFSPEHGFTGAAGAGEKVYSSKDSATGLQVVSLYGKRKKPYNKDVAGLDVILFDIQDVGVRFYTYISTLHYVMEACAQNGVEVIVLDRPNPNGHYVDGPVLKPGYRSFVGMHPIPIVHGMTIGEYAQMINGEKWLEGGIQCKLSVIPCGSYDPTTPYKVPVSPSPNLKTQNAILLYPSLCLFEGTVVSIGRGTNAPFEMAGHPEYSRKEYSFTPRPNSGAKNPKLEGELCYGVDLRGTFKDSASTELDLTWIYNFYNDLDMGASFFNRDGFFDKLAGSSELRKSLRAGMSEHEIRETWQDDLNAFRDLRRKYLIYSKDKR